MYKNSVHFKKRWVFYILSAVFMPTCWTFIGLSVAIKSINHDLLLASLVFACLCLIIIGLLYQLASLLAAFYEDGISYVSWKGRAFLPWIEVTLFRVIPPIIILQTPMRRVVLLLTFYQEPSRIIKFVQSKTSNNELS
jgi:hypothetical protein